MSSLRAAKKDAMQARGSVLSDATTDPTCGGEVVEERGHLSTIPSPVNWPMTMNLDKHELAILMPLVRASEALMLGYLHNQRLIQLIEEKASMEHDWTVDSASVTTMKDSGDPTEHL